MTTPTKKAKATLRPSIEEAGLKRAARRAAGNHTISARPSSKERNTKPGKGTQTLLQDNSCDCELQGRFVVVKVLIEEAAAPALFERLWSTRVRSRAGIVRTLAEKQLTTQAVSHEAMKVLSQLGFPPVVNRSGPSPTAADVPFASANDVLLKHPPQHILTPTDAVIKAMDDVVF